MPTVCVDFDGVLASWKRGTFFVPGPPIIGAKDFLRDLASLCKVIIFTCRTNQDLYPDYSREEMLEIVQDWLDVYGMKEYVSEVYCGPGKPLADCYIDDRAVPCVPEVNGPWAYEVALGAVKQLSVDDVALNRREEKS